MIATVVMSAFVVLWVGIAIFARTRQQSWTIALGGGFLASAVAVSALARVLIRDRASSEVATEGTRAAPVAAELSSGLREKDLYNPSIPTAQREATVKRLLAGQQFNGGTPFGVVNYTLNEDGTRISTRCIPYGEVSERKFTPDTPGHWRVEEKRYRDTGKIYYAVTVQERDQFPVMELLVDRDRGLLIHNGGDPPSTPTPGHTTFCGT